MSWLPSSEKPKSETIRPSCYGSPGRFYRIRGLTLECKRTSNSPMGHALVRHAGRAAAFTLPPLAPALAFERLNTRIFLRSRKGAMTTLAVRFTASLFFLFLFLTALNRPASGGTGQVGLHAVVDSAVLPVMEQYGISGMAVGITVQGERFVFNYGVQSTSGLQPVTDRTLFEIGSVSKTFTALLASYAEAAGRLSMSGKITEYMPGLRGSAFDNVSLINLATYTSGGLPLQVPAGITGKNQLASYFKNWQPLYEPGTHRDYSNPSIGLLGVIAAGALNQTFTAAVEEQLLAPLGMTRTFYNVPQKELAHYAQGYNKENKPVRLNAGRLSMEAYGIKSCAPDMLTYLEALMGVRPVSVQMRSAMDNILIGRFRVGGMTQCLAWERYAYPARLETLLQGNSDSIIFGSPEATPVVLPESLQESTLMNKTGSTNGFSTYVVFVPARKTGIVLMANKNLPIAERVRLAWRLLVLLETEGT